jgi:23S rRNA pseudouridine1911/1915/1917 synthase
MLEILYEDDFLLFLNKPSGIVVQRGFNEHETTLWDEALAHTQPLFLLQRLDRGTSGVIFFSKLDAMNVRITRRFEKKTIRKRYLAIVEGELAERQTIDAPMKRIGAIKFAVGEGGKRAITDVEPLHATPRGSLISINLRTGRTHQIRVHLAAIGYALAGDWLYGTRNADRPMLHSAELDMMHPATNAPLHVTAPLPPDFLAECGRRGIVTTGGQNDPLRVQLNH